MNLLKHAIDVNLYSAVYCTYCAVPKLCSKLLPKAFERY